MVSSKRYLKKGMALFLSGAMVFAFTPAVTPVLAPQASGEYVAWADEADAVVAATEVSSGLGTAVSDAQSGDVLKLTADQSISTTISINNKKIVLDLNGKTLSSTGTIFTIGRGGELQVVDSTVTQGPTVDGSSAVTYTSGKVTSSQFVAICSDGGSFVLKSGTVESTGWNCLWSGAENRGGGTVTIDGGYVIAQEFCIGVEYNSSVVNVRGGVLCARDNAVVGGNGTTGHGGTAINISGGTLIGNIQTAGYSSCGIYAPNSGTVTMTGGKIISLNGAGIVARAGTVNVVGGEIDARGDSNSVGKVGDSLIVVTTSGIVVDRKAGYPGAASNDKVAISGNAVVSGTKSAIETIVADSSEGQVDTKKTTANISVTGGTFSESASIQNYLASGFTASSEAGGSSVAVNSDNTSINAAKDAVGDLTQALKGGDDKATWGQVIKAAYLTGKAQSEVESESDATKKANYEEAVDALKLELSSIKSLDMSGKKIVDNGYYDGTDAGSLAYFTGLERLNLSGTGVTDLGGLASCTELKELDLSGNDSSFGNLGVLESLGKITSLDLSGNTGAAGLINAAHLANLEVLNLANTGFANNDFGPIVEFAYLKSLDLSSNPDLTAIGPITTNGSGKEKCAKTIEYLDISNTGIQVIQEVWDRSQESSSLPRLKTLHARNLSLSSISGLTMIAAQSGFNPAGVTWDLLGSYLSSDGDNHISQIQNKFPSNSGGSFIAPSTTAVASVTHSDATASYSTLQVALDAAQAGDTVTLLTDVTSNSLLRIDKSITLDLGGKTLTRNGGNCVVFVNDANADVTVKNGKLDIANPTDSAVTMPLVVSAGKVTVDDLEINSTGTGENSTCIRVDEGAHLVVKETTSEKTKLQGGFAGVTVFGNGATLEVQGGTISGSSYGISGNGSGAPANTITVTGGSISAAKGTGIYHPESGKLTVSGGTVSGTTGIEIRAGELEVSGEGTKINGGNSTLSSSANGNGTTTQYAGIAVVQHTTKQNIKVEIKGGEVSGGAALYEANLQNNSADDIKKVEISITGGKFTGAVTVNDAEAIGGAVEGGTFGTEVDAKCFKAGYALSTKDSDSNMYGVVQLDYSTLDAAISTANEALASAKVSADGSDVYTNEKWVDSTAQTALSNAIDTAKGIKEQSGKTQTDVGNAVTALNGAVATFRNALKDGTAVPASTETASERAARLINALPAADKVAASDEAAIEAARKAYDNLTDAQKAAVPAATLKKLTDAEASLKAVKQAAQDAADKAAADAVAALISKLPAADAATAGDEAAAGAARKAYDGLTDAQKKLVDAAALARLAAVEGAVAAAKEAASPAGADDLAALKAAVDAAQKELDSLAVSADGTDVAASAKWVSADARAALGKAVEDAKAAYAKTGVTKGEAAAAARAVAGAQQVAEGAAKAGKVLAKGEAFTVTTEAGTFAYEVTGPKEAALTKASKTKSGKGATVNTAKKAGVTYKVTAVKAKALKSAKLKSVTIGKNVKSIGAGAFKGAKKLKTVTVKSKKLTTKKSVKNALKGSKVKTVKLKSLGSKKAKVKKAIKKYAGKSGLKFK